MLPEQGSAAVLGGPAYDQFLLPVHVLPGETMAAATQDPRHVKWLAREKKQNTDVKITVTSSSQT